MAKRSHEVKKVSDSFKSWLEDNNYIDKSLGFRIKENWQEIAGNTIFNHTDRVDVQMPKIFLKINNSSLREHLFIEKQLLIDKVNEYIRQEVIQDIIFT